MWSRRSIEALIAVALLAAVAGCATPARHAAPPAAAAAHPAAGKLAPAGPPPIPPEAQAQFDRALALAKAGNDAAAQAQLASLAQRYRQFHTPLVDLGILYRRGGNMAAAERALRQAVTRDPHSARAWTELGLTQRLAGEFQAAARSYGRAITADPAYAPAYRDRGVLLDLYLGEPAAALSDFQRYRELTGEDRPVAMWIAELQHRTGIKAPAAAPAGTVPHAAAAEDKSHDGAPVTAAATAQPEARN
jgi:lipoprotein NlpI